MPTDEWERGFAAGYRAATRETGERISDFSRSPERHLPPKKKRKASTYSKRYGREFKRLSPKYKRKNGGWGKDGFKRCQAAAHRATRKAMK